MLHSVLVALQQKDMAETEEIQRAVEIIRGRGATK